MYGVPTSVAAGGAGVAASASTVDGTLGIVVAGLTLLFAAVAGRKLLPARQR